MLIAYLFLVLCTTVLIREPFTGVHFQPKILWSWKEWNIQKKQIIANVIMFIPIGVLLGIRIGWQAVFVAAWISVAIEVLQLLTGRGLCEIDDVIHNSFGAAVGVGFMMVINHIVLSKKEHSQKIV